MRFTLTYDGPLPSRGNVPSRVPIREALHPQLRELWNHEPLANTRDENLSEEPQQGRISILMPIGAHVFAPLVCTNLRLLAELDILMLRPEVPGRIINHGDIDNRLKTLFDALRAPSNEQEIGTTARASSSASPTFTLLEDDRLITRVNVETDRLLDSPAPDHVRLIIRVILRASRVINGNLMLIS
ncbi:MAG TPA: hypothetical protein VIJ47_05630 [Acidimicrobiales bacterium]